MKGEDFNKNLKNHMNIIKINDTLIKIILTEEELYFDYDLSIDDLLDSKQRSTVSKVLIEIVRQAADQEQITIKSGLDLKVTLQNTNEIVLMVNFNADFNENGLYGIAKYIAKVSVGKKDEEINDLMNNIFNSLHLADEDIDKVLEYLTDMNVQCLEDDNIDPYQNKESLTYIIKTNTLDRCINLSKIINNAVVQSKLYKLNNEYYLELHIKENTDEFILSVIHEYLFTNLYNMVPSFLEEHGEIIIKENAIKNLMLI